LACSKKAGQFFFGESVISSKKFNVIIDSIDIKRFEYIHEERERIRHKHDIGVGEIVLGFVGRLSPEKNLPFAFSVFEELLRINSNSKMLVVGDGLQRQELEVIAQRMKILKHVVFVGNSVEVPSYMSAMDALILPSFNEGFGMVLLEAQANSLLCFASQCIPEEANVSTLFHYINIYDPPNVAAKLIDANVMQNRAKRADKSTTINERVLSSDKNTEELEKIYISIER
jgi:glycosyltransferase involved in cell wall biosynthesis